MKNLLDSTDITTVFLDQELRVARFTSGASRLFQLLPGDVGRPLTDITSSLDYPGLPGDAREVLRTLAAKERSVTTRDGHWYSVRIMPYRSHDERIEGLVFTFTDTTAAKVMEQDLRATAGQLQDLLNRLTAGYALCSAIAGPAGAAVDGRLLQSNRAFRLMLAPGAAPATLLEALPELRPVLQAALARTPMSGEPSLFERPLRLGAASFELVTYRPAPDQFVCIFGDIKGSGGESGRLFGASGNGGGHADA
jgi:PAS domain-containing protein